MFYVVFLAVLLLSACSMNSKIGGSHESRGYYLGGQPVPLAAKAYQATYSCPKNFAYTGEKFYSDGLGHLRVEISGEGAATPTVVQVLDLNTGELMSWTLSDNRYIRRRANFGDPLYMRARMTGGGNSTPLGAKSINGHPCHGWKGELGGEVWLDDDYGCFVEARSGDTTSTMTQFSTQAPDPSLFQPPQGYVRAPSPSGFGSSIQQSREEEVRSRTMRDVRRLMH